ncbi:hypothetical protein MHYP_G00103790 [Metynnis hypsauchen]
MTGDKNEWINRGRFSLFDDTRAAQVWVMIRELTVEDSGTYRCGVDMYLAFDVFTPVELKVEEDLSYEKSISVTGHVGGSVTISCKYPQSHSSVLKFLCKTVGTINCTDTSSEVRRWMNERKLSRHYDSAKKIFTVSFNSLTEGDSGEYWCGAESDWIFDPGNNVYITQINLTVTEPPATSSSPPPSSSTPQSTETTCSTSTMSPSFKTSAGPDVLPQSSKHISSLTNKPTPSSPLSTTDSPPPAFPVSSVVTGVSVVLLLLLIGLLFFIVTFRKRRKTRDGASTPTQSLRRSSSNYTVSHDCFKAKPSLEQKSNSEISHNDSSITQTFPSVGQDRRKFLII